MVRVLERGIVPVRHRLAGLRHQAQEEGTLARGIDLSKAGEANTDQIARFRANLSITC
jgi:hypothetical protein